jgi:hypothetical protein
MMGLEGILAIIAVMENLATVAADWAKRESFNAAEKQIIERRLQTSRDRLQAIYDQADASP